MTAPVLVLGANGMLGHRLVRWLAPRVPVVAAARRGAELPRSGVTVESYDDLDAAAIDRLIDRHRPAVVLNAVGVVKQRAAALDPLVAIEINSLLPHRLAAACAQSGARLIHFSTDCVFSGSRGNYAEDDLPDACDLYGRSKLLGEVSRPRCLTIRTSMIGPELGRRQGLLEWARAQAGREVQGYRRAIFSGLPTIRLAQLIHSLIDEHPALDGLFHVAADPISKYDLLHLLDERYRLGLKIVPADIPVCDRSLDGSRFRRQTGFVAEPWPTLVDMMARDEETQ